MALSPDVMLDVRLSSICSKHRYTDDPAAAIDELLAAAGSRSDILAEVAGTWAGYHGEDRHCRVLASALRGIDGAERWVGVGRYRRGIPNSGATPLPANDRKPRPPRGEAVGG
jgi:hypothetical protein